MLHTHSVCIDKSHASLRLVGGYQQCVWDDDLTYCSTSKGPPCPPCPPCPKKD